MTIVEKLESILPDVLKKNLLDKLVPLVKNDNKKAIPPNGVSNEAGVGIYICFFWTNIGKKNY